MVMTRQAHLGYNQDNVASSSSHSDASFVKPLPFVKRCTAVLHILDLPIEILERILMHVKFKEMAVLRIVSQKFNNVASNLLTKSFQRLQNQALQRLQVIKTQMPRRESLRRKHHLANQCDILDTVCMRFNLLHMTFGKHMERKIICFFPGEILDEVVNIMERVKAHPQTFPRVTDELCDLSGMAIEYFHQHLDQRLRHSLLYARCGHSFPGSGSSCTSSLMNGSLADTTENTDHEFEQYDDDDDDLDDDMRTSTGYKLNLINSKLDKLTKTNKRTNNQIIQMKRDLRIYRQRSHEQACLIAEYASRIDEHDKIQDENLSKINALSQELKECKCRVEQQNSLIAELTSSVQSGQVSRSFADTLSSSSVVHSARAVTVSSVPATSSAPVVTTGSSTADSVVVSAVTASRSSSTSSTTSTRRHSIHTHSYFMRNTAAQSCDTGCAAATAADTVTSHAPDHKDAAQEADVGAATSASGQSGKSQKPDSVVSSVAGGSAVGVRCGDCDLGLPSSATCSHSAESGHRENPMPLTIRGIKRPLLFEKNVDRRFKVKRNRI